MPRNGYITVLGTSDAGPRPAPRIQIWTQHRRRGPWVLTTSRLVEPPTERVAATTPGSTAGRRTGCKFAGNAFISVPPQVTGELPPTPADAGVRLGCRPWAARRAAQRAPVGREVHVPFTDEQQLRYYRTFGFLKFSGCSRPRSRRSRPRSRKSGRRAAGPMTTSSDRRSSRSSTRTPISAASWTTRGSHDVACAVLGDDFNYESSDGNYYVGDTKWHSDKEPVDHRFLQDRLLPGSGDARYGLSARDSRQHVRWRSIRCRAPRGGAIHDGEPTRRLLGRCRQRCPCVSDRVDARRHALFNHKLKHSSWGGGDRRRMFTMNLQPRSPTPTSPSCAPRSSAEFKQGHGGYRSPARLRRGDAAHRRPEADAPPGAAAGERLRAAARRAEVASAYRSELQAWSRSRRREDSVRVGSGAFRYDVAEPWALKIEGPNSDVAGVAVNSKGEVHVLTRSPHPVLVFDRDGRSCGLGRRHLPDDARHPHRARRLRLRRRLGRQHRPQVLADGRAALPAGRARPPDADGLPRRRLPHDRDGRPAVQLTHEPRCRADQRAVRDRRLRQRPHPPVLGGRAADGVVGRARQRTGPVPHPARHLRRPPRHGLRGRPRERPDPAVRARRRLHRRVDRRAPARTRSS